MKQAKKCKSKFLKYKIDNFMIVRAFKETFHSIIISHDYRIMPLGLQVEIWFTRQRDYMAVLRCRRSSRYTTSMLVASTDPCE